MDELFKMFIASQERIAAALERIASREQTVVTVGEVSVSGTKAADEVAKKALADEVAKKALADEVAKKAEEAKKAAAEEAKKAAAEEAKKAAAEEAAAAPAGPTYTIDQVRAALKEYRAIEGAPAMMEVLKTHGKSDSIATVDEANFAAIMEAVGAA